MTIDNDQDLAALKRIGTIVADVLRAMGEAIEPGMTTRELDALGAKLLKKRGAQSAPILTYDFPGSTCISVNECVAHGIPDDTVIQAGDMVNIDVSAEHDGYFADTGGTFLVPPSTVEQQTVCRATRAARTAAVRSLRDGALLNLVGREVEKVARKHKLKIIQNLAGHGVGGALHEAPKTILNHYQPGDRRKAHNGLVLAIEPFLSTKSDLVDQGDDGWSLFLNRGGIAAQYEHTIVITKGEPIILTLPSQAH